MQHAMIFSGFGGQGIMLMGQLCAQAGLEAGKQVSWFPSYGPEMRGGTAFCSIVLSDDLIGSPVVIAPDVLVVMNLPSLHRFAQSVRPGGMMIVNSSLIPEEPEYPDRADIRIVRVPMNAMAEGFGDARVLSVIALGVVAGACAPVEQGAFLDAMQTMLGKKLAGKPALRELNDKAFQAGYDAGTQGALRMMA